MADIRYPRSLRAGDCIEVPAPSMGVPQESHDRMRDAASALEKRGYEVNLREHAVLGGLEPASAADRAADLYAAFSTGCGAVLPPWGGELAIELVSNLDWNAIAATRTWFVGWSDISTLLLPLTIVTGCATLHGANLMDEPWELPNEFHRWTDVVALTEGDSFEQHAAPRRRSRPWSDWSEEPLDRDSAYEEPTQWRSLDGSTKTRMRGRLIGGCLETVSLLAGSRFGDVRGFASRYAPDGVIVYLEVSGADAVTVLRMLWTLRLNGWFEQATGILIGRSSAPDTAGLTQSQAVQRALGDLGLPIILDFDTGHQPPQMPLINGALADVSLDDGHGRIVQRLLN